MLYLIFFLVNLKLIFFVMIIKRIEIYMIIYKICMKFLMNFMLEKLIIFDVNNYRVKLFRVNKFLDELNNG